MARSSAAPALLAQLWSLAPLGRAAAQSATQACDELNGTEWRPPGMTHMVRIGAAQTLTGSWTKYGNNACQALTMLKEYYEKRGEALVTKNGDRIGFSFHVKDVYGGSVGGTKKPTYEVGKQMMQDFDLDAFMSPYSSSLGPYAGKAADEMGVPTIAWGSAAETVFECTKPCTVGKESWAGEPGTLYCANYSSKEFYDFGCQRPYSRRFQYLFQTFVPAGGYFRDYIGLTAQKGARKIAFIQEPKSFTIAIVQGAIQQATDYGMEIIADVTFNKVADAPDPPDLPEYTGTTIKAALTGSTWVKAVAPFVKLMKANDIDVVVGGTYDSSVDGKSCAGLVQGFRQVAKWFPKGLAVSACPGSPTIYNHLREDLRWVAGPTQFDETLIGRDFLETSLTLVNHYAGELQTPSVDTPAPQLFNDWFVARFGARPSYQAASACAGAYVIEGALKTVTFSNDSARNRQAIRNGMQEMFSTSFWGINTVDPFGKNERRSIVTYQYDERGEKKVVTPISAATSGYSFMYPMPQIDSVLRNKPCHPGHYPSGTNKFCAVDEGGGKGEFCNTTCLPCPGGTYSHVAGQLECRQCEAGWAPNEMKSACELIPLVPAKETMNPGIIAAIVVGTLLVFGAPTAWKMTANTRRIRALYNNNLVAEDSATAIAAMRLEDIAYLDDIPHPNKIQTAFLSIIHSIKQYRSFLPQAVLQQIDEGAEMEAVDPPRGRVAIVFTDIVGSTKLWEAAPDSMNDALEEHNFVVRKQIRKHKGYEVKTIGDAFLVSFADPVDAVLFGMGVQEALLRDAAWPQEPMFASVSQYWAQQCDKEDKMVWNGIAVRIGVSYGEVTDEKNPMTDRVDYRGKAMNLGARLESSAPHGAVQVADDCHAAVRDDQRLKAVFTGPYQKDLKGIGKIQSYYATALTMAQRKPFFNDDKAANRPRLRATTPGDTLSTGNATDPSGAASTGLGSTPIIESGLTSQDGSKSHSSGRTGSKLSGRHSSVHRASGPTSATKMQKFDLRLVPKNGTVAVVSQLDGLQTVTLDFHSESTTRLTSVVNSGLSACLTAAARTQGKVSTLTGMTAFTMWNVISPCAAHTTQALTFAGLCENVARSAVATGQRIADTEQVMIGVASGQLLQGNVGNNRQRFHTAVGIVMQSAEALCTAAPKYGARCLACYMPHTPEQLHGFMRPVDTWGLSVPKRKSPYVITAEQPDLNAIRNSPEFEMGAEDDLDQTVGGEEKAYRRLYLQVLQEGSASALQEIEDLVKRGAMMKDAPTHDARDITLGIVVAQLRQHIAAHAVGAPYRTPAPFGQAPQATVTGPELKSPAPEGALEIYSVQPSTTGTPAGGNPLDPPRLAADRRDHSPVAGAGQRES